MHKQIRKLSLSYLKQTISSKIKKDISTANFYERHDESSKSPKKLVKEQAYATAEVRPMTPSISPLRRQLLPPSALFSRGSTPKIKTE